MIHHAKHVFQTDTNMNIEHAIHPSIWLSNNTMSIISTSENFLELFRKGSIHFQVKEVLKSLKNKSKQKSQHLHVSKHITYICI